MKAGNGIRGRYAPSPTGALHLGNARTALLAWLHVRALGGTFVMRVEDLDRPRCVPGATEGMLADLRWLGLDWDEGPDVGGPRGPYLQSERSGLYEDALDALRAQNLIFECFCTRGDIAAASAPHGPGDEGPRYPGTCRTLTPAEVEERRRAGRKASLRFKVAPGLVPFEDELCGRLAIDVSQTAGDFVVRRNDGLHAYQLAVAVDDAAMGITHVLRGQDLIGSTPRQIRILQALGQPVPRYAHVPLVLGPDGQKFSKRNGDLTLTALRARGVRPESLVAALARSSGLTREREIAARELLDGFALSRLTRDAAPLDLIGLV